MKRKRKERILVIFKFYFILFRIMYVCLSVSVHTYVHGEYS